MGTTKKTGTTGAGEAAALPTRVAAGPVARPMAKVIPLSPLNTGSAPPIVQQHHGRWPSSVVLLSGSRAAMGRARILALQGQLAEVQRQFTEAVREALDITRQQVRLDRRFAELDALHSVLKPRMDALSRQLAALGHAPKPWRYPPAGMPADKPSEADAKGPAS